MSNTVDSRVVEMRFDNKNFESNVATSMSTLDKLKQKLNLSGASKGLDNLNNAAKKCDLSGMSKGIETVNAKFSAMQVVGMTAISKITNAAMNAGSKMISALTIDPVKDGMAEYETQLNAVQTILANTQKEHTNVKMVNSALDELNTYADKTIYNFTEMTRNIGTFTAAGVKLNTSVKAIQGIANLAAVSGSTSQQASTAMYQLSQALAAGKVNLMDWNSVVNAGMGGQVFQDALIRTSENLKTGAKEAIKTAGTFRESLTKSGWLTTEVLTETLNQFSGAYSKADLMAQGYTEKQANEIVQMAKVAENAATKVKTFTQLIDTLKEALGSGWTESWRLIIGDFEEAKSTWTKVSDVLGDIINKSSKERNDLLKGWAKLGGRTKMLESFANVFKGLSKIISPISKSFREVFPKTTADQLYRITDGINKFTKKLIISDSAAKKLHDVFKGLFSILKLGVDVLSFVGRSIFSILSSFSGFGKIVLDVASEFGRFLSAVTGSISDLNLFGKTVSKNLGGNMLSKAVNSFELFGSTVMKVLESVIESVGSVGQIIADVLGKGDIFEVFNSGIIAGILLAIKNFTQTIDDSFENFGGIFENVKGILDDVRGCFKAYQDQLKASALIKIAAAIAILAGALYVISTIDSDSMTQSIAAITILFGELIGAMALLNKFNGKTKLFDTTIIKMIGMATAIFILAQALKSLSGLNWNSLGVGLTGVSVILLELVTASVIMSKTGSKMIKGSVGLVLLAASIKILASACKDFSALSWNNIGKGLAAIGGLLAEISIFTVISKYAKHITRTGVSLVLISASLKILASAMNDIGKMNWESIGKSLAGIGGALSEIIILMNLIPNGSIFKSTGLLIAISSLKILASAMNDIGGMNQTAIGKSLLSIAVALSEFAIALNLMRGTAGGSASLLIASIALATLTPVMNSLGKMKWESIAKGLVAIAGAFSVVGVAGTLLSPLIPSILGLSAAFVLLGIGMVGIGVGLAAVATGFTAISAAGVAGATSIVTSLTIIIKGILNLIPEIAKTIGEGIVEVAKVIGEKAPQLAESFFKMVSESLKILNEYAPEITDQLLVLLIKVIDSLADHIPTLIESFVNLFSKVFSGFGDTLSNIDTKSLLQSVLAVGLMSIFAKSLAGVTKILPKAMLGLAGVGVLIGELSVVLAALGGLKQIPGLTWLIDEGGVLLEKIGSAIGKLIGGFAGGVANGFSSNLPEIGTNLSSFLKNLKPFLDSIKTIDDSSVNGVNNLGSIMKAISKANISSSLSEIVSFGSNPVDRFIEDITKLINGIAKIAKALNGSENIDMTKISQIASIVKIFSDAQSNIGVNTGLLPSIFGKSDIGRFADQITEYVNGIKNAVEAASTIPDDSVNKLKSISLIGKAFSELASTIQYTSGLNTLLSGKKDIGSFGKQIADYIQNLEMSISSLDGLDTTKIKDLNSLVNIGKIFSDLQSTVPNVGGLTQLLTGQKDLSNFGYQIASYVTQLKTVMNTLTGTDAKNIENIDGFVSVGEAMQKLQKTVEPAGGLVQLLTGQQDLSIFGTQVSEYIKQIKMVADTMTGQENINLESVNSFVEAGKAMVTLQESIPKKKFFDGTVDLSTFGEQIKNYATAIASFAMSVVDVNTEKITQTVAIGNTLVTFIGKLTDLDTSGLSAFANVSDVGNAIGDYASAVAGIDTSTVSKSISAATRLRNFVNTLADFDASGILNFKVGTLGKAIANYSSSVSGFNAAQVTSSIAAAKKLKSFIESLAGMDTSGVSKFKSAISELGKTNVSAVASTFSKGTSKITSAGKNLTKSLASGVKSNSSSVTSAATSMVSSMQKSITSKTSSFSTSGSKLIMSFVKGINSKKSLATAASRNIATAAASASRTGHGTMVSNGSYLGSGLVIGVRSKISAAYAAGYALGRAAVQGEKDGQRSNSPSKETIKAGHWLGEGLVIGIHSMIKATTKAGKSMGQATSQSISDAVSSAATMFDMSADSTPTIRPVVDLSDVKDQASIVSSLFSNPTLTPTSDIRAINTLMSENHQNGNEDVVNAINKLRKGLDNVGNTYNSINGVTYDNGSSINDAVETIFRAARIERRR